jgi:hypothetical protein
MGVEEPQALIHAPNESVDPREIASLALAGALPATLRRLTDERVLGSGDAVPHRCLRSRKPGHSPRKLRNYRGGRAA